jgi:CRISPR/Cas system CMR-associated protein Cmr1 (group 7 of RAMP superfamily)
MMLSLSFTQRQEQKLNLEQKVFGNIITVSQGICPICNHQLSDKEILKGFSKDPYDFNTTCPKCGKRFLSYLIIKDKETEEKKETVPVVFMCQEQTLHAMKEIKEKKGKIGVAYLGKNNRQLFYNMIRHWGTYKSAIQMLN